MSFLRVTLRVTSIISDPTAPAARCQNGSQVESDCELHPLALAALFIAGIICIIVLFSRLPRSAPLSLLESIGCLMNPRAILLSIAAFVLGIFTTTFF